jgi:hypothetical protein
MSRVSQIFSLETTRQERPNDMAPGFDARHEAQEARDYVISDPRR